MTKTRLAILCGITAAAVMGTVFAITQVRDTAAPFKPAALGMNVPVVSSQRDFDRYLGRVIAIRGAIDHTKAPTILGVFVRNPLNLDGIDAYAVGVLARWESTPNVGAERTEVQTTVPSPYPDVSHTLYFDLSGKLADARAWPGSNEGG